MRECVGHDMIRKDVFVSYLSTSTELSWQKKRGDLKPEKSFIIFLKIYIYISIKIRNKINKILNILYNF